MDGPKFAFSRRYLLGAGMAAAASWGMFSRGTLAGEVKDDAGAGFIDAHVHIWTPDTDRYPLAPDYTKTQMVIPSFTPKELFTHARPCGVRRIVLIQMSYYGSDNSYMLDMMQEHKGMFSGVGIVDQSTDPPARMRELARRGVRGFRIVAGSQAPDHWLGGESMAAMWKCGADEGLAICLLMDPRFLPSVDAICRKFPQTPVVVDHFARIGIDGRIHHEDLDNLCGLARHKSIRVKLSAYYALGKKKTPYLDLAPMIRRLLDAFGPDRLMWASDSPFQVLEGHRYQDSIDLIRTRVDFLSAMDRDWLLRRTAEKTFFS
ncbi:MAG: amidohydrolase family protein [Thermoguttaceae bacterium]